MITSGITLFGCLESTSKWSYLVYGVPQLLLQYLSQQLTHQFGYMYHRVSKVHCTFLVSLCKIFTPGFSINSIFHFLKKQEYWFSCQNSIQKMHDFISIRFAIVIMSSVVSKISVRHIKLIQNAAVRFLIWP